MPILRNTLLVASLLCGHIAHAEPTQVDFWGEANAREGTPINGLFSVTLRIEHDGNVVYEDAFRQVPVTDGRYLLRLGESTVLQEETRGTVFVTVGGVAQPPLTGFELYEDGRPVGTLPDDLPPHIAPGDEAAGLIGSGHLELPHAGGLLAPAEEGLAQATPRGDGLHTNRATDRPYNTSTMGQFGGSMQRAEDPTVDGPLDVSLVDAVVKRHVRAIQFCYQRAASTDASLAGSVTVTFTIEQDGTTSGAAVVPGGTLTHETVTSCITGRFARMRFPDPNGASVRVTYPFVFNQ